MEGAKLIFCIFDVIRKDWVNIGGVVLCFRELFFVGDIRFFFLVGFSSVGCRGVFCKS